MPTSLRPGRPRHIGDGPRSGAPSLRDPGESSGRDPDVGVRRRRDAVCHLLPEPRMVPAMATYLYRLGGWAHSRRRLVLALWLVLLTGIAVSATAFKARRRTSSPCPAPSPQQAQNLLEERFPGAAAPPRASSSPRRRASRSPIGEPRRGERPLSRKGAPEVSRRSSIRTRPKALTEDGRIGFADVIYPMPAESSTRRRATQLADTAEPARAAASRSSSAAASSPGAATPAPRAWA